MDSLSVRGGRPLVGNVHVSGAKNAALPLMAAGILCDGELILDNCPRILDVEHMAGALVEMGVRVSLDGGRAVLNGRDICETRLCEAEARQIRSSIFALGAVLVRCGEADFPTPGGCRIGSRPIDQHILALRSLGAEVVEESGRVKCRARRLTGARITLGCPSVGATEDALLAAVLARGGSVIENAACEPEISELAGALREMGAQIEGEGTPEISVIGVERLHGARREVCGDRIEAATFMAACAAVGGSMDISGVKFEHVLPVTELLDAAGADIHKTENGLSIYMKDRPRPFFVKTAPWPGFPTDAQPAVCAVAARASGVSVIEESVFDNRLSHIRELEKLGCSARISGRTAIVKGSGHLCGSQSLVGTDLRAAAALVTAALAAEGDSRIDGMRHLVRGYENFDIKLRSLGARIN